MNQYKSFSFGFSILLERAEDYIIKECVYTYPYKKPRICYEFQHAIHVAMLCTIREFFKYWNIIWSLILIKDDEMFDFSKFEQHLWGD